MVYLVVMLSVTWPMWYYMDCERSNLEYRMVYSGVKVWLFVDRFWLLVKVWFFSVCCGLLV